MTSRRIFKMIAVCIMMVLSSAALHAQTRVAGTVTDEQGQPLIGVTVLEAGTVNGTQTDFEGKWSLQVVDPKDAVIQFSCLGYQGVEENVGKRSVINVIMIEDSEELEEVVLVGYGTQRKVNLTGSVVAVSTKEFTQRPITQLSTALQGVAPGVTVTTGGGAPGSDSGNIQIRGIGSFGGSSCSPLVLIDGVEGSMNTLDASQVDQISVLKDAASCAIYGNRAANGVILITTKRADKGRPVITYRGYVGWQQPVVYPNVVNAEEYMTLYRQACDNDGTECIYTDDYIANYRKNNYLDPDAFPITNWQKRLMTGSGFTHNHVLSLSAGNDRIKILTSAGYLDQEGIIKNSDYKRYNLRSNMDITISKKLQFRLDLNAIYSRRNANRYQGTFFYFMNTRDPLLLGQWSDGNYAGMTGSTTNVLPMAEQNAGGNNITNSFRLNISGELNYKPLEWLEVDLKATPRFYYTKNHKFTDLVTYYGDAYGTVSSSTNAEYNSLTESIGESLTNYYHATVTLGHNFNGHDLKFLAGYSYEDYDYHYISAYRQDFDYPAYEVISAGGDNEYKDNSGTRSQWALSSFFARLNYNYRERYLFEANVRYDGSSRFAKGNRWGVFPSFSAGWRISEEKFMKPAENVISNLKIRASWGQLGNQDIGSSYYPTTESLAISSIAADGSNIFPIVTLNTLANPDLTWETSTMTDVGIDATLWHKFTLTADYYHKVTDGILMELTIPSVIGLNAPYQNAGIVHNDGWELSLGYDNHWGDFTFGVQGNLSDVRNKIVNMDGTYLSSGVIRNQEGYAINSLYLLNCLGIVQTQEQADWINANCPQYGMTTHPGDLYYEDANEDGVIDDDDRQILGCMIPRYTFGLNLNFGWKGINLSAQFQGVGKADGYISGYYTQPCVKGATFHKEHLDSWTPENTDAKYPRLSYVDDLNRKSSTFWMANAAYLRLKNLMLSYTFPKKLMSRAKIDNLMVYVNATNLFTIDNYYPGYDVETNYQDGDQGATTGEIGNNYPLVSTYTFGLEIRF
ncbi:MAG: TonB-dependent receptor [Clostridia bacterium]|nr:TonB-dependent receptor [Clostridia bacterium]